MAVRWLVRLLVVVMTAIVVFAALGIAWASLVAATGGGGDQCGDGTCGTLGDWDYEHGAVMFFGTLALALLSGVVLARRFPRSREEPSQG